jgi:alpha-tubulin suppressor-like RCC1 family protein/sugar lactone lactonase YvrE
MEQSHPQNSIDQFSLSFLQLSHTLNHMAMKIKSITPGALLLALLTTPFLLFQGACKKIDNLTTATPANARAFTELFGSNAPAPLQVYTLAGDGTPTLFNAPGAIAIDATGNTYVADAANNRIRKITPAGNISTLAGNGQAGLRDTTVGTAAMFNAPSGLVIDAAGNVLVADKGNHRIRKITQAGVVTTVAGADAGFGEGPALDGAKFNGPTGVAIDADGNIYVADTKNYRIRLITATPPNLVVTLAGNGTRGSGGGDAPTAQFNKPVGIALDAASNIYVADSNSIRKIAAGQVATLAGSEVADFAEGNGTAARFNKVSGLTLDATGNIYVADQGNSRIRLVSPAGAVSTFAGNGAAEFRDGALPYVSFNLPAGVAIDAMGNVCVADAGTNRIRIIAPIATPAGGGWQSFILKTDNTLWATGSNAFGQLGDGSNGNRNTPVKIMTNVKTVSAGDAHTLILKKDNSLWATGINMEGELGDGTNNDKSMPVKIMDNVQAVAAGNAHSLILKTDNSLWATGYNTYGQLGDGTSNDKNTPVKIMDNVKAIAAGYYFSLILKTDNSLWATGINADGELGDGSVVDKHIPVKITDNVQAIAAGGFHSLILKTDNSLWVAGDNSLGQLGDGTATDKHSLVKIMDNVQAIAGGAMHTLILKTDNSLWGTGDNAYRQFGVINFNRTNVPQKIMDNVIAIAAGANHSIILKPGNNASLTAGYNLYGQLGDGTNQIRTSWVSMILP